MAERVQPSGLFQRIWRLRLVPLRLAIKGYQRAISPLLPANQCRFHPSCSHYALDALEEHGVIKGLCAATWRVLRCNPFGGHGVDQAKDFRFIWEKKSSPHTAEGEKGYGEPSCCQKPTATAAACSPMTDHHQNPSEEHSPQT